MHVFDDPADPRMERVEQAGALLRAMPIVNLSTLVLAASAANLLIDPVPASVAGSWLAAVTLLLATRFGLLAALRPSLAQRPERLLRVAAGGALLSGLVWSALPWIVTAYAPGAPALLTILMLGVVATAVTIAGQAYVWYPLAFMAPVAISVTAAFLATGQTHGGIVAVDTLVFTALLVRLAMTSHRSFLQAVRLAIAQRATSLHLAETEGALQESKERLQGLADRDGLTGTLSRGGLVRDIDHRIANADGEEWEVAVVIVDFDDFHTFVDSRGHAAGNAVLADAAKDLSALAGDRLSIGRLGTSDFALVMSGRHAAATAAVIGQRLVEANVAPADATRGAPLLRRSAGMALFPDDGGDGETLLARAEIALHDAREAGSRRLHRFEPSLLRRLEEHRQIEDDLPAALREGRVTAHFQPKISLVDGRICGCEALLRWNHPTLGWIAPPKVVAAARAIGQSDRLTRAMLEAAVALRHRLSVHGLAPLRVAVNVSPADLTAYSVAALVAEVAGADPAGIEIEITEDAEFDLDLCGPHIEALRRMGVSIAVDDFGSGYTSLAYLSRLRADRLKIDRQFVADLSSIDRNAPLIRAVLDLGRAMGMEVVAEGVETADVAERLKALGCKVAQGFHFARPMPADALIAFAEARAAPQRRRA